MYFFAVCDDNKADAAFVVSLIENWNKKKALPLQIELFSSAEELLFAREDRQDFDLLLLDIEMGRMNGVELAKKLRKMGARMQIVFVTGFMDYISEGYDVEALHYLMKPVTGEKLEQVLDRALERIRIREKKLVLSLPDGVARVELYEIRYLEVQKNYVTVHANEDYRVKKTLNELEEELDDSFFKVHRSYIVGLRFVRKILKTEVILKDNTAVPLSRKFYDGLNQAMIRYF